MTAKSEGLFSLHDELSLWENNSIPKIFNNTSVYPLFKTLSELLNSQWNLCRILYNGRYDEIESSIVFVNQPPASYRFKVQSLWLDSEYLSGYEEAKNLYALDFSLGSITDKISIHSFSEILDASFNSLLVLSRILRENTLYPKKYLEETLNKEFILNAVDLELKIFLLYKRILKHLNQYGGNRFTRFQYKSCNYLVSSYIKWRYNVTTLEVMEDLCSSLLFCDLAITGKTSDYSVSDLFLTPFKEKTV